MGEADRRVNGYKKLSNVVSFDCERYVHVCRIPNPFMANVNNHVVKLMFSVLQVLLQYTMMCIVRDYGIPDTKRST